MTIALINNEARVKPFQVLVTQYCVDTTKNVPTNRVPDRIELDWLDIRSKNFSQYLGYADYVLRYGKIVFSDEKTVNNILTISTFVSTQSYNSKTSL